MNDPMDLPSRGVAKTPDARTDASIAPRSKLTERQLDVIVDSGAQLVSIAAGVMDIVKIKAQTQHEVAQIEARSRAVREAIRGEIERMEAARETIVTRGDVAIKLTRAVLQDFTEYDSATRQLALETLTKLVDSAINAKDAEAAPKS
ncbi:hypothetical protein RI103_28125 [Paraburkholderia sp. FT54]|uniref:hypothetical protein n=1 Tax=Paraburkholderia sp. FT54 TaxID=3074437 RepID=UPI0028778DD3|nr:hypothetical protein [Paraburkholderia sp. FT54]WNC92147.1 hypothetical protein RI103_28125 [Paraburkholderia sp. FT54]